MIKKLVLLACALLFTGSSAMALEFQASDLKARVYGQLNMGLFYVNSDQTMTSNNDQVGKGQRDYFDLALYDFTRVGVNLIFNNFSGTVELQAKQSEIFRRFFINYNFDNGAVLTFGKEWTPVGYSYNQFANNYQAMWDYGVLWDQRQPEIMFSYAGFQIAAIYSDISFAINKMDISKGEKGEVKSTQFIPRFEAAYGFNLSNFSGKVFAGYSHYSADVFLKDDIDNTIKKDLSFDTYVAGLGLKYVIGKFYISATGFFGQNLELTGQLQYMGGNGIKSTTFLPSYDPIANKKESVMSTGGALNLGYNITDRISVGAGAGYTASSNTSFKSGSNDDHFTAFFNVPIVVAKYLNLIPEISYFNEMRDYKGKYQGSAMYYGLYILAKFE